MSLTALVVLLACTETPPGTWPPGTTPTLVGDSGGDTVAAETDDGPAPTGVVSGVVVGPDRAPAADLRVVLCRGACRYVDTGPDGSFRFEEVEAASFVLHVDDLGGRTGWADELVPLSLADGEELVFPLPFTMVPLGQVRPVPATPTEVEVVDGLWLAIDPATLDLAFADAEALSGAAATSFPPSLPDREVVAVWFLSPFDARADPPLAVRAANTWGLAPGEALDLLVASYEAFAWVDAGTVTVSSDGAEIVGGAVPTLTTLVLARR